KHRLRARPRRVAARPRVRAPRGGRRARARSARRPTRRAEEAPRARLFVAARRAPRRAPEVALPSARDHTRGVRSLLIVAVLASAAHADDAKQLGKAFAAYDRNDLATAAKELQGVDKVVNKDYLLWLRGMIALRTNKMDDAQKAFEQLGKQHGSRYAPQVAWRLADCAWAR